MLAGIKEWLPVHNLDVIESFRMYSYQDLIKMNDGLFSHSTKITCDLNAVYIATRQTYFCDTPQTWCDKRN